MGTTKTRVLLSTWISIGLCTAYVNTCIAAFQSSTGSSSVNSKNAVILAGDRQYPPFHFLDGNGKPTGYDVELFKTIAESMSLTVDIRLGNWASKLNELEAGKVDVIPMFISEDRKRRYLFTRPFITRLH